MTLAISPLYPVPGDEVTLGLSNPAGNAIRGELTSVPSASALAVGLLVDPATGAPIATFTPDVPGAYGVKAHDYRDVVAFGGRSDYLTTQSGTVYVGAAMDLPIRTQVGHGATLRLTVVNATVRAAELLLPLTEVSRVALLDAAVVAALAALVDVAVANLDVDLATDVAALRVAYEAHRVSTGGGTVHASADTTNVVRHETPTAIAAAIDAINDFYDALTGHITAGALGGTWHDHDDGINVPVCGKALTLGEAVVLKADLRERVYEAHRIQVGTGVTKVHLSADSTNTMAAPLPLPVLIVALLDAIVAAVPSTPAGEQAGVVRIEHTLGFRPAG